MTFLPKENHQVSFSFKIKFQISSLICLNKSRKILFFEARLISLMKFKFLHFNIFALVNKLLYTAKGSAHTK